MADLPYPYFGTPQDTTNWLDAQRKQQVASMLMDSLKQANQTPADWNSMKVVPKRGMLQNVAVLTDALLAKKGMDASNQATANYMNPQPQQAQQQASVPNQDDGQTFNGPTGAINVPGQQQSSGIVPQTAQQTSSAQSAGPQSPMLPPGMSREQAAYLARLPGGMEAITKLMASNLTPLEIQRQLQAAGIQPNSPQGQAYQQAVLRKASTNMQDVRPGGTLFDINTGAPLFTAPQNGVQTQWGPNGPSASLVPGAVPAAAAVTGAETGARTANTPAVIPTAGGGSTYGYPEDILGAPPALRTASQAPGAPAAPPVLPRGPTPQSASASVTKTPTAPTGTAQAPAKAADPWTEIPKLQISNAPGAPNAFVEGRLKAAGEKDAQLSTQYGEEANLADQKLQYNAEARKALPNAEVGPLSEWLTHNRAKLTEIGVPDKLIPGDGSVTPTLELNKYLKNAALQGAKQTFGSRMTQNEVMLQHEELSPSTSMTRDAIASLINQDDVKQQYAKQRAEDYGKYVQQGGDPLRFESWYSKNFPLNAFAQQHSSAPPGQATSGPAPAVTHPPADLEAEMRRRGLLK